MVGACFHLELHLPPIWPPSSVRCGCAAVVWERSGKGNADIKRSNVSTIRETQTKDRWRLRAANLNDIDGLHALAASPLVYRYLFDGALPDKEYITRLLTQSVANAGETGLGMWFLEDASVKYCRLCRVTTLSISQIRRSHLPVRPPILGTGTCPENGVNGDHPRLFVVTN